jgi:hypothetical protein
LGQRVRPLLGRLHQPLCGLEVRTDQGRTGLSFELGELRCLRGLLCVGRLLACRVERRAGLAGGGLCCGQVAGRVGELLGDAVCPLPVPLMARVE